MSLVQAESLVKNPDATDPASNTGRCTADNWIFEGGHDFFGQDGESLTERRGFPEHARFVMTDSTAGPEPDPGAGPTGFLKGRPACYEHFYPPVVVHVLLSALQSGLEHITVSKGESWLRR